MSGAALRRWWQRPTAPLLVIAAVKFAIHLATNGMYGFQRDELYDIISGQRPMLGYVDYPPVTAMLAWLNTSIFGISPWTFRLFPALAGTVVVFLAGMCAREMGTSRGIAILAPYCGAVTRAGTVVMPFSVVNQEAGAPILICTNLRESIDAAWTRVRNFS